jgi:hypothetical protein
LKPPQKARSPHDQKLSNTRFDNNSNKCPRGSKRFFKYLYIHLFIKNNYALKLALRIYILFVLKWIKQP